SGGAASALSRDAARSERRDESERAGDRQAENASHDRLPSPLSPPRLRRLDASNKPEAITTPVMGSGSPAGRPTPMLFCWQSCPSLLPHGASSGPSEHTFVCPSPVVVQ